MLGLATIALMAYFILTRITNKNNGEEPVQRIVFPKWFMWSLGLVIVAFNIFIYETSSIGIGPGLFNLFLTIAILLTFPQNKKSLLVYSLAALNIFTGLGIAFRANGFVQSVNGFATSLLIIALLLIRSWDQIKWKGLWLARHALSLIPNSLNQLRRLFLQSPGRDKKRSLVASLIKTTALTLVIVIFFANILSNADPVFKQIIDKFMDEIVGRALASLIVAVIFSVFFTLQIKTEEKNYRLKVLAFHDVLIPTAALITLLAVFIFVQLRYLFGSHHDLTQFNLTYSEYVRKGFTELLIACFFGSLVSYLVILKSRIFEKASQIKQLQLTNIVLLVELFFLLVSAFKRDIMYVEVYGLTRVRIIGGIFLVWLAVLLLLLAGLTIYRQMKEKHLFSGIYLASILVVLSLNLINIDKIVASYQPLDTFKDKDYFYINNLSEDAIDGWEESIESSEKIVLELLDRIDLTEVEKKRLAIAKLSLISIKENRKKLDQKYLATEQLIDEYFSDYGKIAKYLEQKRKWQAFNLSEFQAFKRMQDKQDLFYKKVDRLIAEIESYQEIYEIDLYEQENWRLREFEHPFVFIHLDYYPRRLKTDKYPKNYKTPESQTLPSTPSVTPRATR